MKNPKHEPKIVLDCLDLPEEFNREPLDIFNDWLSEATKSGAPEPTAFCLSTIESGSENLSAPHSRMLLLKGVSNGEFNFFTNYLSPKAHQLEKNTHASMVFFWPTLVRQVRVLGSVSRTSGEESDLYFSTRPRGSQIGAWTSQQSAVIPSRQDLVLKFKQTEEKWQGKPVPRPKHWGGYSLIPVEIEFWIGQESRLHDRFKFVKASETEWKVFRLSP